MDKISTMLITKQHKMLSFESSGADCRSSISYASRSLFWKLVYLCEVDPENLTDSEQITEELVTSAYTTLESRL